MVGDEPAGFLAFGETLRHADVDMTSLSPTAVPTEADWLALARRIETAKMTLADDPLFALAQLVAAEDEAQTLVAQLMEFAVRQARETGSTWAEIAAATGVKDRQAAWRRWTDRGIH